MNDWLFEGQSFTEPPTEYVGFVYMMTNLENNKRYIGKKNFWMTKVSQKKNKKTGKIKKTRTKIPSDWIEYHSSNDEIKEEYAKGVPFKREIIKLCRSKSEMTYWETKLQFQYDVLINDEFYNQWIMCKIRAAHLNSLRANRTHPTIDD